MADQEFPDPEAAEFTELDQKRGPGRPKGSTTKPKTSTTAKAKQTASRVTASVKETTPTETAYGLASLFDLLALVSQSEEEVSERDADVQALVKGVLVMAKRFPLIYVLLNGLMVLTPIRAVRSIVGRIMARSKRKQQKQQEEAEAAPLNGWIDGVNRETVAPAGASGPHRGAR